jgi:hypothetical protein
MRQTAAAAIAGLLPPLTQSKQNKMACPHLYIETEIRHRAMPTNSYAERGRQIHAAIEAYLLHLVETKQPSDYNFFDDMVLNDGYGREARDILMGMKDSLIIDPERVLAIEPYLALDEKLNPLEVDTTRPSHMYQEQPPAAAVIAGIPDVIMAPTATEVDCWDWKSYFQIIEPDTFQAELYPLLIFKHYPGVQVVRFHLRFVRYGVSRMVEYSRAADLERLEELARSERARQQNLHVAANLYHESIERGPDDPMTAVVEPELEAMPGPHCIYCPKLQYSIARVGSGARQRDLEADPECCPIAAVNPYTEQAPETRLKFAVWAKAATTENANVLREFVRAGGPVEIVDSNGMRHRAAFEPDSKLKYPLIEVQKIIAEWDAQQTSPREILLPRLCVGSTELRPLIKDVKKRAQLRELIEQVAYTKPGSKWKIGRVGEEEESNDDLPY